MLSKIYIWCNKSNSTKKWEALCSIILISPKGNIFYQTKWKEPKTFTRNCKGKACPSSHRNNTVPLILQCCLHVSSTYTMTQMLARAWPNATLKQIVYTELWAYHHWHACVRVCGSFCLHVTQPLQGPRRLSEKLHVTNLQTGWLC